jgi:hypothetical protein
MSKAKTASKNNPTNRQVAKDIFYNDKKVKPVKYIGLNSTYMAVAFEDGTMPEDNKGNPIPWSDIRA